MGLHREYIGCSSPECMPLGLDTGIEQFVSDSGETTLAKMNVYRFGGLGLQDLLIIWIKAGKTM